MVVSAAGQPEAEAPRYGIVTCGKIAPPPLDLGPCRLDPDHDGPCQWRALGGTVTIEDVHRGPSTIDMVRDMERMHRQMRRNLKTSAAATFVTCAAAVFLMVQALKTVGVL
jgi:hypothetical protein